MRRIFYLFLIMGFLLGACNLPTATTPPSPYTAQTSAAMTVQALLAQTATAQPPPSTLAAQQPSPTQPAATPPPLSPTPQPSATPAPSPTPVPSPTTTPKPCNVAHFVADVTVPDGTTFNPGASFTKTWRLQNVGSCTWQNYSLVFDSGDPMGGPTVQPIPGTVAPGQQVDVSVNLTAPSTEGTYKGYWRLRDDKGVVFGLTTGNAFWVAIKVVKPSPTSPPTLPPPAMLVQDFYASAPQATWRNSQNVTLPFPGSTNDQRGFARYADGILLEDGHAYSHVLETYPQWVALGSIRGRYPAVTLPSGAHFRAKIGFLGGCNGGDVRFQLYGNFNNGSTILLGRWHETCDGALRSVDVDLSSYAGKSAVFSLAVYAGSSPTNDRAVWVAPVVSTP